MTEYEKMHHGMIYDCLTEELGAIQKQSHRLCDEYNALGVDDDDKKQVILKELPERVLAAGNPCKVIRVITEQDSMYLKAKRD